jgi:hypothetical protein
MAVISGSLHLTVVAIQGESYRLKDMRRTGLLNASVIDQIMPAPSMTRSLASACTETFV